MAKKLIDILSDAAVVRDETNEKANTAERVGGVLVELANYLSAFAPVSDVTVEADGSNIRLVLHLKNEDGTVSTRGVTLPAASTENAGVLTTELLKALNAADRANEDLAQEGISRAESASAMLFEEEAARKEADLSLNDLIEAEVTERLQSVATEAAARKAADEEIRAIADEGLDKADAALEQIFKETTARTNADAELLKRIIGKSTSSSAYTDPFKYLYNFASEKDENGTVTKNAIRVMQDYLLDTLRHPDFRDSFPFIGHMRAHIEGVPIECWTYVKAWNTGSTNGVFVQVVRTNFGLKNGVISSALTEAFHEYFRTVTVGMANGSVTDVTATEWKESTLRDTDRQNIASIAFLGDYNNINEAAAQAATVQYAGNADYVLLRFRIGGKGGLILQNVNGNSTEQYLFNDGKRYLRYVDFTSADRTAVKTVQAWKLDGVAYIFYDSANRIIYQRNQWDEKISGGRYSTLPLASASYAGMLSTTMFNHLSNFNIYEHSVPTTTSVRLVFTNPITGTATNVTLAAVTSARAGVMTADLYNELKQATAGVAAEEAARISLRNQIAADIQSIRDAVATVQANESNHYNEMQTNLSSIYKRLAAAETRIAQLEQQLTTK